MDEAPGAADGDEDLSQRSRAHSPIPGSQRHLDLGPQPSEWCAKLMGRERREAALVLACSRHLAEEVVQRVDDRPDLGWNLAYVKYAQVVRAPIPKAAGQAPQGQEPAPDAGPDEECQRLDHEGARQQRSADQVGREPIPQPDAVADHLADTLAAIGDGIDPPRLPPISRSEKPPASSDSSVSGAPREYHLGRPDLWTAAQAGYRYVDQNAEGQAKGMSMKPSAALNLLPRSAHGLDRGRPPGKREVSHRRQRKSL